jgi:hypothetical protein
VIRAPFHLDNVIVTMDAMNNRYLPISGVPTEFGGMMSISRRKKTFIETRIDADRAILFLLSTGM